MWSTYIVVCSHISNNIIGVFRYLPGGAMFVVNNIADVPIPGKDLYLYCLSIFVLFAFCPLSFLYIIFMGYDDNKKLVRFIL